MSFMTSMTSFYMCCFGNFENWPIMFRYEDVLDKQWVPEGLPPNPTLPSWWSSPAWVCEGRDTTQQLSFQFSYHGNKTACDKAFISADLDISHCLHFICVTSFKTKCQSAILLTYNCFFSVWTASLNPSMTHEEKTNRCQTFLIAICTSCSPVLELLNIWRCTASLQQT